MSCFISASLPLDCMGGLGGLKTIYFLGGTIDTVTEVTGEITAITGTGSFYQFGIPKDTAFFNETINVSNVNGTVFYQGELTIVLQNMSAAKRNQILLLAQNRELKVAFVDNRDVTWIMGLTRGAQMSAGSAASGTAPGDLNGYTLTFQAMEPQPASPLADDLAATVTGITIVLAANENNPTTTTTTLVG